jgi:hypothetical protein
MMVCKTECTPGYQNSTAKYTLFHVQLNSMEEIP